MQRTIAHRGPKCPPTDRPSDADLDGEFGALLREYWREVEPLNANRVWRAVSEQISHTEQSPRSARTHILSPFTQTLSTFTDGRRLVLALATAAAIGIIGATTVIGGASTSAHPPAASPAAPPPPSSLVTSRMTQIDAPAQTVNDAVASLATFATVAIEDGILSADEHISIQQRTHRIAAGLANPDTVSTDLTTTDIQAAAVTVAATTGQLAQHRQPDNTTVDASIAALHTLATSIAQASAAIPDTQQATPVTSPNGPNPQRSARIDPPPPPPDQHPPLPGPKSDPTSPRTDATDPTEITTHRDPIPVTTQEPSTLEHTPTPPTHHPSTDHANSNSNSKHHTDRTTDYDTDHAPPPQPTHAHVTAAPSDKPQTAQTDTTPEVPDTPQPPESTDHPTPPTHSNAPNSTNPSTHPNPTDTHPGAGHGREHTPPTHGK